jgi:aryl-alcohol dehydrogenase-like predicted oxidoreductase
VQATWNVLERSAGDALAAAHDAGWGVLVKEALANGRLAGRGTPPITAALGRVAARHGIGEDAIALAAVLANPWADVALSGAVTPAQVRSNASAVDVELSREDLAELGSLAVEPDAYWSARSALAWT